MSAARPLPYSRHAIDEADIAAVAEVLRGDWLTTGPLVRDFETALARQCGAAQAISCANGTAALHLASLALGLGADHTVIVPTLTFAATANAPRLAGAEICFADCDPESGLMGIAEFEAALARLKRAGKRAAAVFPVDLAGQCADLPAIAARARAEGLAIVEDSCHALGSFYRRHDGAWQPIGSCADSDITVFSFHPVKTIAAGEGGAALTNQPELARRIAMFRNHGVVRDPAQLIDKEAGFDSAQFNPWYYEMVVLGLNYRLSDINCALANSQLGKLAQFVTTRQRLAARYDALLSEFAPLVKPIARQAHCRAAWHLYSVLIDFAHSRLSRGQLIRALEERGIRSQVHYIPVHRHPYYRERYGASVLPGAEAYYRRTLSLPLFVGMGAEDVDFVVATLAELLGLRAARKQAS
ncbi:MAG TPA: UDP-4-amino-4,6-dideoxy-N-acetyl-beta-L-altrosamine transaminase [Stellaceae bacterium]|nr:UDP-4-amino-4,6-dideoxy-N-acetyl-beta-L-altrosamine transaminase [Stellaceae bacterium]